MYFRLTKMVGCGCVCVLFGVAETKIAVQLMFIVRYIMFKRQFVLYKNKGLLALPHYTEFLQTVSKGVGITSTFYSLQSIYICHGQAWEGCQMGIFWADSMEPMRG